MRKLTHDYFPRNDPVGVEMEMIYIYILVISTPPHDLGRFHHFHPRFPLEITKVISIF